MIDSFPLLKSLTPRETWEKVLLLKATRLAISWRLAAAAVARRGAGVAGLRLQQQLTTATALSGEQLAPFQNSITYF